MPRAKTYSRDMLNEGSSSVFIQSSRPRVLVWLDPNYHTARSPPDGLNNGKLIIVLASIKIRYLIVFCMFVALC